PAPRASPTYMRSSSPDAQGNTADLPAHDPNDALPPNTTVSGRYKIIQKLAEGGMGEVYKVEHVELGKAFAMKVMKSHLGREKDFADRFKREAVAATQIGHPNIVDVSDFGRTED